MRRVAIIGAGLAGTACAYVLRQRGVEAVIYEAGGEIAPGASGNALGLYNPRISAERTMYGEAFQAALKTFEGLGDIDWVKCGSLHLVTDEKKEKRFAECVKNWGWAEEDMRLVDADEASSIAGVELQYGALWIAQAGVVSPKKLCGRYAEGIEVHLNTKIGSLAEIKADAVIVANGMGAKDFEETKDLPLRGVRGQITFVQENEKSKRLKCNLCYGGYFTPGIEGTHAVGSTFQRWLDHSEVLPEDDADNLRKLAENIPAVGGNFKITGQRAAVRTTTDGHFPIMGRVKGHERLYVSTAHGSHGIVTSVAAAHLIADDIMGRA